MSTYQDILDDLTSSRFIKDVIRAADGCDPVDVLNDLEKLTEAAHLKVVELKLSASEVS